MCLWKLYFTILMKTKNTVCISKPKRQKDEYVDVILKVFVDVLNKWSLTLCDPLLPPSAKIYGNVMHMSYVRSTSVSLLFSCDTIFFCFRKSYYPVSCCLNKTSQLHIYIYTLYIYIIYIHTLYIYTLYIYTLYIYIDR